MTAWYFQSMGREVGPFSGKELLAHVRTGRITSDTPVRKDDSQWVPASDINGLFEAAAAPTKRVICPYCSHPVNGPVPCECEGCRRYLTRVITKLEVSKIKTDDSGNLVPAKKKGLFGRLFSE